MSRFHWVRHGPTHAKAMVGWTDLPADLSDTAQLARLSDYLPQDALIVSSDLTRAHGTANAIAAGRTRLPDNPQLREINFGAWEMANFDTAPQAERLRAFWETPGDLTAPEGESWNMISTRVSAAAAALMRAHPGRDIIVVAHMGAILTQVQAALDITGYEAFGHRIDNLSVTSLQHDGARWRAETINHLP
ncbi:Broad specificity phosphatase PhoE [Roseovarius nanhaiticus]|uniref:Broad specificity phosphatase PhoE n=1 Tax=Roseovarius nanhaiticus TaxID=573024 RepID=A0A1N7EXS5_9RHOB|nr:histidine phosphatase family protein [Roseovarius nanhaiticus]SEK64702.1 Broad specificity phosphatase PhoE [Roseovarius nanhaiticus]SIR92876.1 Broad specificity phosphatase PhoE [Roseovarius nanhaiticus]